VWLVRAGQGAAGAAWCCVAGRGRVRHGEAGTVWLGSSAWRGLAWQAWLGPARRGVARFGRQGVLGLGNARLGVAGSQGAVGLGMARHGEAGTARCGWAWGAW
jgi:hypothetical protein